MVIEFLRHQGGACHETEGLTEILENEFPGDGIATRHFTPAFDTGERRFACIAGKFFCHIGAPSRFVGTGTDDARHSQIADQFLPNGKKGAMREKLPRWSSGGRY